MEQEAGILSRDEVAARRALALGLGKVPGPDRLLIEEGERWGKVREKAKVEGAGNVYED